MPAIGTGGVLEGTHQNPEEGGTTGSAGADCQMYCGEGVPRMLLPTALFLGRGSREHRSTHPPYGTDSDHGAGGVHEEEEEEEDGAVSIYSFSDVNHAHPIFQALFYEHSCAQDRQKFLPLGSLHSIREMVNNVKSVKDVSCQIGSGNQSAKGQEEWFAISIKGLLELCDMQPDVSPFFFF